MALARSQYGLALPRNPVLFHATEDHWYHATQLEGGVAGFRLKIWRSRFPLYASIPLWLSPVNRPAMSHEKKKAVPRATPPQNRGVMRTRIAPLCGIPLSGPMTGRSRPHLSLREGLEQPPGGGAKRPRFSNPFYSRPLSPRASLCRIGPRRQGSASPLRALDGSGPIRKTRCSRGERGGSARGVRGRVTSAW